jgi:hypothetical protein
MALEQAMFYQAKCSISDDDRIENRGHWLSSIVAYIRSCTSLIHLINEGWFIFNRPEIVEYVGRNYPNYASIIHQLYQAKCVQPFRDSFVRTGQLASTNMKTAQTMSEEYGSEILGLIRSALDSNPSIKVNNWLSHNLEIYQTLPMYRDLVLTH